MNSKKVDENRATTDAALVSMPRKIRQLIAELEAAGFVRVDGGKGSHRKFRHTRFAGAVILSGQDGHDAQHYQEKQIRHAIRETNR